LSPTHASSELEARAERALGYRDGIDRASIGDLYVLVLLGWCQAAGKGKLGRHPGIAKRRSGLVGLAHPIGFLMIEPKIGGILWSADVGGLVNCVSGKFICVVRSYQANDDEEGPAYTMDSMMGKESVLSSISRSKAHDSGLSWVSWGTHGDEAAWGLAAPTQSKNPRHSSSCWSLTTWSGAGLVLGSRAGPTSTPSIFITALAAPR
jgi:hypothetical protein